MSADEQARLLTLTDVELLKLAPEATHQHFKGGLYRVLGLLKDSETGKQSRNSENEVEMVYEHLYPHAREFWKRSWRELYGFHESGVLRFREIEGSNA